MDVPHPVFMYEAFFLLAVVTVMGTNRFFDILCH